MNIAVKYVSRPKPEPISKAVVVVPNGKTYELQIKPIKDCRSSELQNERTRILIALLHGEKLSRAKGWNDCGVLKLPTRIGEVQQALTPHGIIIMDSDVICTKTGRTFSAYTLSAGVRKMAAEMWEV